MVQKYKKDDIVYVVVDFKIFEKKICYVNKTTKNDEILTITYECYNSLEIYNEEDFFDSFNLAKNSIISRIELIKTYKDLEDYKKI